MNKPELIDLEVDTPDGRGSILSLHSRGVVIHLNKISPLRKMKGRQHSSGSMHYFFPYEEVEIIKGQYNFKDRSAFRRNSTNFRLITSRSSILLNLNYVTP